MRHRKTGVKLNRTTSHRIAMFRNMVTSLLKYERIRTTNAKAKELRRWADHIITLAKRGDLHARRQALSIVREKAVVHKLFEEADQRFGASAGGYTRVIKLGRRQGDAAPISLVELVISEPKSKKKKAIKKTKKPEAAKKKVEVAEKKGEVAEAPAVDKAAEPKKEEQKLQKAKAETKAKKTPRKKAAEEPEQAKPDVKAKRTATKKETTDKPETQPQAKAKPATKKPKTEAKKAEKTETKSKAVTKKTATDAKSEAKAESKSKPATKKKPSADK